MRYNINEKWYIVTEEHCFKLCSTATITGDSSRGRAAKAENIGKTREEVRGFYGKLGEAAASYVVKSMNDLDGAQSLQQLADHHNKCLEEIRAMCARPPTQEVANAG